MTSIEELVTARVLEQQKIMRASTAYRMAEAGQIPYYVVGCRGRGVRFRISEVLAALRRPAVPERNGAQVSV